MDDTLMLVLAWAVGVVLGVVFFGGLWWTVRKALASPNPAVWFLTSMLVRMGITVGGFYLIADGRWQRLLICLVGFVMARLAVTWLTRPSAVTTAATMSTTAGTHAS